MTRSKELMAILNHHLATHINEKLSINDSYRAIKVNDFTITYKGNINYKGQGGFLSVKFRGYKFKSRLYDGFLVNINELAPVGVSYNKLPFYDEMITVKNKLCVYTDAVAGRGGLNLAKIFVYFPLNGQQLHYLLMFDTGENFLFVSDIPEMLTNPVEFTKQTLDEDFYKFIHVNNNFSEEVEQHFLKQYKKHQPQATTDDFLVAIMQTI